MFVKVVDPFTGQQSWRVADEHYDLAQEIARSRFADMIRDKERNQIYENALHYVISDLKKQGKSVHVYDIGAGTGLLSMMAARAGADRITAFEVFEPMARCAENVIEQNGFRDKITLIPMRSTDFTEEFAEENKADVIVAEVFDTELIGEGALRTFKEAHQIMAKDTCRVIPSKARIYAAPAQSNFLMYFTRLPSFANGTSFSMCAGSAAVHDLQLSEVPFDEIRLLCEPFVIFEFDFENGQSLKYNESYLKNFVVKASGNSIFEIVLVWWELDMDRSGMNILSIAPKWWNKEAQWRDHWMQAVYYLPKIMNVKEGDQICLHCHHDEFSLWFTTETNSCDSDKPPFCDCKIHAVCSRNAIYRMNDLENDPQFVEYLKQEYRGKALICLNEGSMLGLMAGKYANTVTIYERNKYFRRFLSTCCEKQEEGNTVVFADEYEYLPKQVDAIVSEPFFLSSFLPWHNIHYWFEAHKIQAVLRRPVELSPVKCILYALPVKFDNLWKVVAPVGVVEGFDLSSFDQVCQKARSAVDGLIEPHPLWEYPSVATGPQCEIGTVCLLEAPERQIKAVEATITPEIVGSNAVVFWSDWHHKGAYIMKTGLAKKCNVGEKPQWSVGHRQGVYFLPEERRTSKTLESVLVSVDISDGQVEFTVNIKKQ